MMLLWKSSQELTVVKSLLSPRTRMPHPLVALVVMVICGLLFPPFDDGDNECDTVPFVVVAVEDKEDNNLSCTI